MARNDPPGPVGDAEFEDFLCDVDGDESIFLQGVGSFSCLAAATLALDVD